MTSHLEKSKYKKGKPQPSGPANARNEKRYVFLEAEVRLLKIDNIDQSSLKKVKNRGKWKLLTIVRYDIEGSYYIEVIGMQLIRMIILFIKRIISYPM